MKYGSFLIAVGPLGLTVGILHAATQSPTSGSVLQIIGALIAVCVGVFAGSDAIVGDRKSLKEILPILSKTTLCLLAAYWVGFGATKYILPNMVYALGEEMAHLSPKEKADSHRLLPKDENLRALHADPCLAKDKALVAKVGALAALYEGCVPDLEQEIKRVLRSAPEVSSGSLTRTRMVPEKG